MKKKSEIVTPLKRAEGLGSAHSGVYHWIMLRVSAIALIPLSIWFVFSVIKLTKYNHLQFSLFFRSPFNALLMALLVGFSFYHAASGLTEVIEDYVHNKFKKTITLLVIKFTIFGAGLATILAVVKLHLNG